MLPDTFHELSAELLSRPPAPVVTLDPEAKRTFTNAELRTMPHDDLERRYRVLVARTRRTPGMPSYYSSIPEVRAEHNKMQNEMTRIRRIRRTEWQEVLDTEA